MFSLLFTSSAPLSSFSFFKRCNILSKQFKQFCAYFSGIYHAAAEDLQTPAEAALADGGAQTGQNHEAHTAAVHHQLNDWVFHQINSQKVIQIKAQVDEHHAENHNSP